MSYTISQDQEHLKLATSLQQQSEIVSIRLMESTARCFASIDANSGPFSFAAEFRPQSAEVKGAIFTVSVRFDFKIHNKEKAELVVLDCLFDADYSLLSEGFRPSDEQLEAFRQGPAIFNCWPFFREYVQSTVSRMNYPPPTIPFLWLAPAAKNAHAGESRPVPEDKTAAVILKRKLKKTE